jgi:hypothetical protein
VSETTLKRAVSGPGVPQEATVTVYLRACNASADAERLLMGAWRAARAEQRGKLAELQAPAVENIRIGADLSATLATVYEEAGAPSLHVLRERAGADGIAGTSLLPKTTAWRPSSAVEAGPPTGASAQRSCVAAASPVPGWTFGTRHGTASSPIPCAALRPPPRSSAVSPPAPARVRPSSPCSGC